MTPATKDQLPKEVRERIRNDAEEHEAEIKRIYPNYDNRYTQSDYTAGATHEALRAQRLEQWLRLSRNFIAAFGDSRSGVAPNIALKCLEMAEKIDAALAEAGGAPTVDTYEHP